jgi:hypothetical protein
MLSVDYLNLAGKVKLMAFLRGEFATDRQND